MSRWSARVQRTLTFVRSHIKSVAHSALSPPASLIAHRWAVTFSCLAYAASFASCLIGSVLLILLTFSCLLPVLRWISLRADETRDNKIQYKIFSKSASSFGDSHSADVLSRADTRLPHRRSHTGRRHCFHAVYQSRRQEVHRDRNRRCLDRSGSRNGQAGSRRRVCLSF